MFVLEFGGRQRRQLQRGVQGGLVVAKGKPTLQQGRQHDDAGNYNALIALQCARNLSCAETTVTLTKKIFR